MNIDHVTRTPSEDRCCDLGTSWEWTLPLQPAWHSERVTAATSCANGAENKKKENTSYFILNPKHTVLHAEAIVVPVPPLDGCKDATH